MVSTIQTGTGTFQVTFNQDVSACAYLAQAGSTDSTSPPVGVSASTSQVSTNPDAVAVTTYSGYPTNVSFDLAVFC